MERILTGTQLESIKTLLDSIEVDSTIEPEDSKYYDELYFNALDKSQDNSSLDLTLLSGVVIF